MLVGLLIFFLVGRVRQPGHRPGHRHRACRSSPRSSAYVAAEEIHGVRRARGRGRRPAARPQGPDPADRDRRASRSGSTGAPSQFLLENTVFLLIGLQARWILRDVGGQRRPRLRRRHALRGHLRRRGRAAAGLGVPGPLPAGAARPGRRDRAAPVVEVHRRPRLGRHARRGHAGGGVRDPGGASTTARRCSSPRSWSRPGPCSCRGSTLPLLVRRLRLPAPDPREDALARAALFAEGHRRRAGGAGPALREDDPHDTVAGAARTAPAQRNIAAWERLGSTHPDEETPSEAYARLRLEMLEAEREQGAARPQHRRRSRTRSSRTCSRRSTSRSRCSTSATPGATELEGAEAVRGVAGTIAACEHLRGGAARRRVGRSSSSARTACARASPPGCTCASASSCGHMACCDSSPRQHASAHFDATPAPGDALGRARRGVALVLPRQPTGLTRLGTLAP